jgi:hypothetical protein
MSRIGRQGMHAQFYFGEGLLEEKRGNVKMILELCENGKKISLAQDHV